jgi:hypothetical protein
MKPPAPKCARKAVAAATKKNAVGDEAPAPPAEQPPADAPTAAADEGGEQPPEPSAPEDAPALGGASPEATTAAREPAVLAEAVHAAVDSDELTRALSDVEALQVRYRDAVKLNALPVDALQALPLFVRVKLDASALAGGGALASGASPVSVHGTASQSAAEHLPRHEYRVFRVESLQRQEAKRYTLHNGQSAALFFRIDLHGAGVAHCCVTLPLNFLSDGAPREAEVAALLASSSNTLPAIPQPDEVAAAAARLRELLGSVAMS